MDKSQSAMPMGNDNDNGTQFEPPARIRLATIPELDEGGSLGDQVHELSHSGTLNPTPDGGATP
eukprot:2789915-Heterocapsa_arctica.AAC.1